MSGFESAGLFCNPSSSFGEKLDIYSDAKGDVKCVGSGYHNSTGALCMDDKMKRQLMTRGNNASGSPSIIAGSTV